MWSTLFGGGAAANKKKQDEAKNAIVKLREQVNMLEKKEAHLQKQIDDLTATAKRNVTSNKKAAMAALTRKKMLEKDLDKWTNTKNTIEQQVFALENANINLETMKAMKSGADAMKGIHGSLSPEKVDTIMDDIRDQMAVSNEISEAIARPALGTDIDEDELREELEQLEQEELDTKLVGVDVPSQRMPTAPERRTPQCHDLYLTVEPVQKQKTKEEEDEEAELRALQAEMAI